MGPNLTSTVLNILCAAPNTLLLQTLNPKKEVSTRAKGRVSVELIGKDLDVFGISAQVKNQRSANAAGLEITEEPPSTPAAINTQGLPGNVPALGRREKKYRVSHFLHGTNPPKRYVAKQSLGTVLFGCVLTIEQIFCTFRQG